MKKIEVYIANQSQR